MKVVRLMKYTAYSGQPVKSAMRKPVGSCAYYRRAQASHNVLHFTKIEMRSSPVQLRYPLPIPAICPYAPSLEYLTSGRLFRYIEFRKDGRRLDLPE